MVGPVALGHEARLAELVERALLEPDRERAHPVAALLSRHRRERGGVDAAGEQDADGHVGDQVRPDRVPEPLAKLLGEHVVALGAHLGLGHG